jgi:hypothetical protein
LLDDEEGEQRRGCGDDPYDGKWEAEQYGEQRCRCSNSETSTDLPKTELPWTLRGVYASEPNFQRLGDSESRCQTIAGEVRERCEMLDPCRWIV